MARIIRRNRNRSAMETAAEKHARKSVSYANEIPGIGSEHKMSPAAWSSLGWDVPGITGGGENNSEKPKPQRHGDRGGEACATIRFLRERNSRHRQRTQNEKQGTDARSVADRTYRGVTAPKPRPNDGMWRQQQFRNNRVQFIESQVKEGWAGSM